MPEQQNPILTFLDRFLGVPEAKVTYLTRATPIDRFLAKYFLRFFPESVTPNQITRFRLLTIPFILLFLALDLYSVGTVLFLFSAFSDALDGALARTKRMITTWGTLYDPIADKLLIGGVSVIIVSKYIGIELAAAIIAIEILLVSFAYVRYKGRVVPAKMMGKTKMVLQCLGIIFLLLYAVLDYPSLLSLATYTLYAAIAFGFMSLTIFRSI
jgi:CDP-diacylglycerol--glycerol-3-phosphate 3-phosphatidyltransferase